MNIKPLYMENLLKISLPVEEVSNFNMTGLEKELFDNNIFIVGPTILQQRIKENTQILEYYIPINDKVIIPPEAKYEFIESIRYDRCAYLRIYDMDIANVTEQVKKLKVEIHKNLYKPGDLPFEIILPVFGGGLIDMYVPLQKEESF